VNWKLIRKRFDGSRPAAVPRAQWHALSKLERRLFVNGASTSVAVLLPSVSDESRLRLAA
jgi:hypothetical protein